MEAMLAAVAIVSLLSFFGLLADRVGADSRDLTRPPSY
jgi:hypothetical protein